MFAGRPIALSDRGKPKTSIPTVDSRGEIRSGYVPNTTLECHHHPKVLSPQLVTWLTQLSHYLLNEYKYF